MIGIRKTSEVPDQVLGVQIAFMAEGHDAAGAVADDQAAFSGQPEHLRHLLAVVGVLIDVNRNIAVRESLAQLGVEGPLADELLPAVGARANEDRQRLLHAYTGGPSLTVILLPVKGQAVDLGNESPPKGQE